MHELGIVFHIIRSVEQLCAENRIGHVSAVTLELGEVSGVVPHYLSDAWRWAAAKHEVVAGAELRMEEIPARTYCESCGATYPTVAHGKTCPACSSTNTYLVQGNEVMIKEIETPEPEQASKQESEPAQALDSKQSHQPAQTPDAVDQANPLNIGR